MITLILLFLVIWGIVSIVRRMNAIHCPDCKKLIVANARICPYCGHVFETVESESSNYKLICANCGEPNYSDNKACPYCGSYWKKKIPVKKP